MSKGKCDFHKRIFAWLCKGIIKEHKLISKMMVLQMEAYKPWMFFVNQVKYEDIV
jgi:hypothetical protein